MTSKEKRKHVRIRSLNLSYVCLDEDNRVVKQAMGRTLNVSESGLLLETHFPIAPENLVLLDIGLENDIVQVRGKPVHSRVREDGKYEIGIQFLDSDDRTRATLKKFIQAFSEKERRGENELS